MTNIAYETSLQVIRDTINLKQEKKDHWIEKQDAYMEEGLEVEAKCCCKQIEALDNMIVVLKQTLLNIQRRVNTNSEILIG
jgi:hypothetical protein